MLYVWVFVYVYDVLRVQSDVKTPLVFECVKKAKTITNNQLIQNIISEYTDLMMCKKNKK